MDILVGLFGIAWTLFWVFMFVGLFVETGSFKKRLKSSVKTSLELTGIIMLLLSAMCVAVSPFVWYFTK